MEGRRAAVPRHRRSRRVPERAARCGDPLHGRSRSQLLPASRGGGGRCAGARRARPERPDCAGRGAAFRLGGSARRRLADALGRTVPGRAARRARRPRRRARAAARDRRRGRAGDRRSRRAGARVAHGLGGEPAPRPRRARRAAALVARRAHRSFHREVARAAAARGDRGRALSGRVPARQSRALLPRAGGLARSGRRRDGAAHAASRRRECRGVLRGAPAGSGRGRRAGDDDPRRQGPRLRARLRAPAPQGIRRRIEGAAGARGDRRPARVAPRSRQRDARRVARV